MSSSANGIVDLSLLSSEELASHLAKRHEKRLKALETMQKKPTYKLCQTMINNPSLRPASSPPRTPRNFESFSKRRWEGACRRFRERMKEWESHYNNIMSIANESEPVNNGYATCSLS